MGGIFYIDKEEKISKLSKNARYSLKSTSFSNPTIDPGGGQGVLTPWNITMAIRSLRNTGTDPLEKQLDP